jgi:hypothetical protein
MKFIHDVKHRICVAYEPANPDVKKQQGKVFKMTTVLCHKNDQYRKETARNLAKVDMESGCFIFVRVPSAVMPNHYFREMAYGMSGAYYEW